VARGGHLAGPRGRTATVPRTVTARSLLFCSDFPLGYHNREAERTLAGFAARGYESTYVEKLGIRSPGPAHVVELARRLRRGAEPPGPDRPFGTCSPRLMPPRHVPPLDAVNRRWLARQLDARVAAPERTILWIRYATPELVPYAERPDWPLVVFEAVDDHLRSPGLPAALRPRLEAAERRMLRRAGLVFAWSEAIAERLRAHHGRVVVAGAGADLDAFAKARASHAPEPRVAGYAGSLDGRFDAALMAETARALPDWRFRLAGPADEPAARLLAPLPNVELLGRVPPESVPGLLAGASVCLMPYRLDAFNDTLFPLKLVESLASGRPTVSTPIRPAREFGDVLRLATGGREFAAAIEASVPDAPGAEARRIARAAPYGWEARLDAMAAAVEEALR